MNLLNKKSKTRIPINLLRVIYGKRKWLALEQKKISDIKNEGKYTIKY